MNNTNYFVLSTNDDSFLEEYINSLKNKKVFVIILNNYSSQICDRLKNKYEYIELEEKDFQNFIIKNKVFKLFITDEFSIKKYLPSIKSVQRLYLTKLITSESQIDKNIDFYIYSNNSLSQKIKGQYFSRENILNVKIMTDDFTDNNNFLEIEEDQKKLSSKFYELQNLVKDEVNKNNTKLPLFDLPSFNKIYKVAIIAPYLVFGGAERVLYHYIESLLEISNIEITLFLVKEKGAWFEKFQKLKINIVLKNNNDKFLALKEELISYDLLINSNVIGFIPQVASLKEKSNIKVVHILHTTHHYFIEPIVKYQNDLDYIITIHDGIKRVLLDRKIPSNKLFLIENAVDNNYFKRNQTKEEAKQKLGFSKDDKLFIYCGRISVEKNVTSLVRVFKEFPKLKLLIIGSAAEDQKETEAFLQENLKGSKNIFCYGYLEDPREILEASDYHLISSFTEGFPISLIETSFYGIPTISTNVGNIKKLVRSDTGYLVNIEKYKLEHKTIFTDDDFKKYKEKIIEAINDSDYQEKCQKILKLTNENYCLDRLKYQVQSAFSQILFGGIFLKSSDINLEEVITIGLLSLDRYDQTEQCIKSIYETTKSEFKILIIDNNSKEDTKRNLINLQKDFPFEIYWSEKNLGVAGGRNKLLELVTTKFLFLLDNDTICLENWDSKLLESYHNYNKPISIQSILYDTKKVIQNAGIKFTLDKQNSYTNCYQEVADEEIQGTTGGATLWDCNFLKMINGFNEDYFIGFEDFETTIISKIFGRKHYVAKDSFIIHDHKIPKTSEDKLYEENRYKKDTIIKSGTNFQNNWGLNVLKQLEPAWDKLEKLATKRISISIESSKKTPKIIISKDAMTFDKLNIEEIPCIKYNNWYTNAPSTISAFISMYKGFLPYECNRGDYSESTPLPEKKGLFQQFEKTQWITWRLFDPKVSDYARKMGVFNKDTKFSYEDYEEGTWINLEKHIDKNMDFVVLHYPHTLPIPCLKTEIFKIENQFKDSEIFVTADHGTGRGCNGDKFLYGFDVEQEFIHTPMFAFHKEEYSRVDDNLYSHLDLQDLALGNKLKDNKFITIETAYKNQKHRKICFFDKVWKYVWNKDREELFNLIRDPREDNNLLIEEFYDSNRNKYYNRIDFLGINRKEMKEKLELYREELEKILSKERN